MDQQKSLYISFVDFEKAFDRVSSHTHWNTNKIGNKLPRPSTANPFILESKDYNQSERNNLKKKPYSAKQYAKDIRYFVQCAWGNIQNSLTKYNRWIKINGEIIYSIGYAHDTILIAESDIAL